MFACRGESSISAVFLTRTPSLALAALQLLSIVVAAALVWVLWTQRNQKWEAMRRWTQAVRMVVELWLYEWLWLWLWL